MNGTVTDEAADGAAAETSADETRPGRRRLHRILGGAATVIVVALTASVAWSGVEGASTVSSVRVDDGSADVKVSGIWGDDLHVIDTERPDIALSFTLRHRGPWPVRILDVWDAERGPEHPDVCFFHPDAVEAAPLSAWGPSTWVGDLTVPLEELPALRGGEELYVSVHADRFPQRCSYAGAMTVEDTVTVTYRTFGITRRTEVPLPYAVGWTDDPDDWEWVERRDEP